MKGSVGSAFLYNLIAIFILVVFAFIGGTLSYYKAYKVNTLIMSAIEKYEGYNSLSIREIDNMLKTIGYNVPKNTTCPKRDGISASVHNNGYCIYKFDEGRGFRSYGVISYIHLDLPIISDFALMPVYSKTIKLYDFG